MNLCNDIQCSSDLQSSYITAEFYEVTADPITGDMEMEIDIDLSKEFEQVIYVKGSANGGKIRKVYAVLVQVSSGTAKKIEIGDSIQMETVADIDLVVTVSPSG